jgi:genome maintenance exonuclease 1
MKNFIRYENVKPQNFELVRDDSGPIRYYFDPEGNKYRSVTSFVGQFSTGKESIAAWREAVGHKEADRITKAAATRGTAIHLACENLLLNREWSDISMFYKQDFLTMKKHLEEHVDNVFVLEHQMYSKMIGLAGTVDCIAEYDGKLAIVDFKTSSRLKYKEDINAYFLQCAAYACMVFERYGIRISDLVILMVVEGGANIEVFIEPSVKWMKELIKLTDKEKKL